MVKKKFENIFLYFFRYIHERERRTDKLTDRRTDIA